MQVRTRSPKPDNPEKVSGLAPSAVPILEISTRPRLINATVEKANLNLDQIDFYLFTQLNARTIEQVMAQLGQPMSKTHTIMDKWGYLGSACIPAALDDALELGVGPVAGDKVLFCASGGGFALAASVWQWTAE